MSKNKSNKKSPKRSTLSISSEILSLFGWPPLLSTEKVVRYDAMLRAFWDVIQPRTCLRHSGSGT